MGGSEERHREGTMGALISALTDNKKDVRVGSGGEGATGHASGQGEMHRDKRGHDDHGDVDDPDANTRRCQALNRQARGSHVNQDAGRGMRKGTCGN